MGQPPLGFWAQKFSGAFGGSRVGVQSDLWISQRHGTFYDSVYGTPVVGATAAQGGSVFRASNQTADSLTVGLATTYTGLCLSNPAASGVNLALKRVSLSIVSSAIINLGLITGWSAAGVVTHTTPVTQIVSAYVGGAASGGSIVIPAPKANVDAACTIVGTPAWDRWLFGLATTSSGSTQVTLDDDLIIPPGGYVAIGNLVATTGLLGTFMWEELAP